MSLADSDILIPPMNSTHRPNAEKLRMFLPLRDSSVVIGSVVSSMYGAFEVMARNTEPLASDSARHSGQVNMYSLVAAERTVALCPSIARSRIRLTWGISAG